MSQSISEPRCDGFANELPEAFTFDPSASVAISFGINQNSEPKFAETDARLVLDSFLKAGAIQSEHAHHFRASKQPEECMPAGWGKMASSSSTS